MNFKRFQVNENVLAGEGVDLFFFFFEFFFSQNLLDNFFFFSLVFSLFFMLFSFFNVTLLLCERTTKNESCKFICQVCGYATKKISLLYVLISIYIYFFPTFFFVSNSLYFFSFSQKEQKIFISTTGVFFFEFKNKKKKE